MTTSPPPSSHTDPATSPAPISVLFVCLGNICRSPMAHAILQHLTHSPSSPNNPHKPQTFHIDSAGTAAYHLDSSPDPRTLATLAAHGITDYTHRARQVRSDDFREFDYVLAMDRENLRDLRRAREEAYEGSKGGGDGGERGERGEWEKEKAMGKVVLFGAYGGNGEEEEEEVGDPYYGGGEGFEVAFEQMVRFSEGFLRVVGSGDDT